MKRFLITLVLCLFLTTILQAAGDLDPLFGNGGKVITDLGESEFVSAVALQPDGKIIAGGSTVTFVPQPIPEDYLLIRYNPNGSLDPTFDGDGIITQDILGGFDFLGDVLVQTDDKIVAVGATDASAQDPFQIGLVRYNQNGSLDPTFGTGGIVHFSFPNVSFADFQMRGALQSDGKILVTGRVNVLGTADFNCFVARFNPNGSIDPTFSGGVVFVDFANSVLEDFTDIAVQVDSRIVVTGVVPAEGGADESDMVTVRFNTNGTQDPTFGSGGVVITDFSGNTDSANALLIQPDQKIVIAGENKLVSLVDGGTVVEDFALVRYNVNGSLDPTFGNGGKVQTDFATGQDIVQSIVLQPNLKIIAFGGVATTFQNGASDFGLARYNPNGSLDPTFGNGGLVITDLASGSVDFARDVALQPDGKIVAAGTKGDGTALNDDFALTRYNGDIVLPPSCGLYSDDFEDGVLATDWNYVKPAWAEVGGNLEGTPTGKKAETIATPAFAGCGTGSCTIQTTIQTAGGVSNQIFFFGWYQDKDNLVEVLMKEEQDKWVIKQISNGSVVAKEKANAIIAPNIFYDVRVAFDGTKFTLNVDGVDLVSMNAGATPSGTVGFRVKKTIGRFGNICAD
jgi:uncharacterized delta-60 repeat protein